MLKNDATFTVRRGLSDSSCYPFESVNYPGRFLRHAGGRIRLAVDEGSALFTADATFCVRPGLGGTGVSLEPINQPGSFVRHVESQVSIAAGAGNGGNRPHTLSADSVGNLAAPWAP
ncbi:hypothetical protein Ait01nite_067180 [Actinoplanes italicus]|uniref:Alpha-L-arabinofuranosidase B-like protein n=1 Tax=Actinoplanes italicus TaxID=113567 RepID=A0A2T0K0Z9_9ACTN|nr:alpha-L-arabinofuranosidase B-like protein [Actinoplanes italicus]GIE33673.1 hypothetical protein Ait01nite_067180 [Actinoplanes italicus]